MEKSITLNIPQTILLIVSNPKLQKHYENYVEKELCKVIRHYHKQLYRLDFSLLIGNVFCNYVRLCGYEYSSRVVESLSKINNLGYIHLHGLERCQKLAEKGSNLLDYYTTKLVDELNEQMVALCDDFEYQLCSIINKEEDKIPCGFLEDFVKTKSFGKGNIKLERTWS